MFRRAIAAAVMTLTLTAPAAHAAPSDPAFVAQHANDTPDQWARFEQLSRFLIESPTWDLTQWYSWGQFVAAHERELRAFYEHIAAAPNEAVWQRMAVCETGGNWSMTGPRYSGGVGFANSTWNAFGGREYAPLAGQATKDQQIIVAERVRAAVGYRAWGCARTIGLR